MADYNIVLGLLIGMKRVLTSYSTHRSRRSSEENE
jgi:hypothetical protein